MKKWLIGLLSLMVASAVFAESDIDKGLKELDVIDAHYVYTDVDATANFFYYGYRYLFKIIADEF